jgi:aspartyl-tRNA(Asn)/glutamyl-tRNA(Gln) amidotransferase subunit A
MQKGQKGLQRGSQVYNLPVGIQLVSRPFREALLIAYGREFQKRTDWHRRRPPTAA